MTTPATNAQSALRSRGNTARTIDRRLRPLGRICRIDSLEVLENGAALVGAVQVYQPLVDILGDSFFPRVVALGLAMAAGATAYGLVSYLMKLQEWDESIQRFLVKIQARFKR